MNREMELDLLDFLEYEHISYLDEICWFIFDEFEIFLSTSTVSRVLGWVGHKKRYVYRNALI